MLNSSKSFVAFLALSVVVGTTSTMANEKAPTRFECSRVAAREGWNVVVNTGSHMASFTDGSNATQLLLVSKETRYIEIFPYTYYTFEGAELNGAKGSRMRVVFNERNRSATVTFGLGTSDVTGFMAEGGCKVLE